MSRRPVEGGVLNTNEVTTMQKTTPRTIQSGAESAFAGPASFEAAWDPGWDAPTLRELADRVEHQFGSLPMLAGLENLGFARDEALTPGDVQQVCTLLGVPAVDFGLDM